MSKIMRKVFCLRDIKYSWLLLLSIAFGFLVFYIDRSDMKDPGWLTIGYLLAFALAVVWGVINYIGHIRMNVMYQKQNNIQAYVENLAMGKEDKLELQHYLEDYAADLIMQGKPKNEAAKEAINQFKVQEILSLSKDTMLFNLHAHYYLIGWAILAAIVDIIIWLLYGGFYPSSQLLLIIGLILIAYGMGFIALFCGYKLMDSFIYRKINEQLT
ncbi:hypothetical protein HYI36_16435 [Bacillus sp. Gen3]|nr:hypothetical protein [Bacillus sp. Gen3]